jgi:hypothetical protein
VRLEGYYDDRIDKMRGQAISADGVVGHQIRIRSQNPSPLGATLLGGNLAANKEVKKRTGTMPFWTWRVDSVRLKQVKRIRNKRNNVE